LKTAIERYPQRESSKAEKICSFFRIFTERGGKVILISSASDAQNKLFEQSGYVQRLVAVEAQPRDNDTMKSYMKGLLKLKATEKIIITDKDTGENLKQKKLKKDFVERFPDEKAIEKWVYNVNGNLKTLAGFLRTPLMTTDREKFMNDFLALQIKVHMKKKMLELKESGDYFTKNLQTLLTQNDFRQYHSLTFNDCMKYTEITKAFVDKNLFVTNTVCTFRFRNNMTKDYVKAIFKIPQDPKEKNDDSLIDIYEKYDLLS